MAVPSIKQQTDNIYIEEIQSDCHQTNNDRVNKIRNRIADLTGCKPKFQSVRKQIIRLNNKMNEYGSYEDRRGGVSYVITSIRLEKGVRFWKKHKNKNMDFDAKLSKHIGIPQTSRSWYRYKEKLSEEISKLNSNAASNKSHNHNNSSCCQVCRGSVKAALYPAFECGKL